MILVLTESIKRKNTCSKTCKTTNEITFLNAFELNLRIYMLYNNQMINGTKCFGLMDDRVYSMMNIFFPCN